MADLQTAFADDDAVDHQLQNGLLLRQGGIGQAVADAIAERRHVGPHRLNLEPLLAQARLALLLLLQSFTF